MPAGQAVHDVLLEQPAGLYLPAGQSAQTLQTPYVSPSYAPAVQWQFTDCVWILSEHCTIAHTHTSRRNEPTFALK